MNRASMIQSIQQQGKEPWDVLIIGGGATGLGAAVEAASRGYKTILLEQYDFSKGTSSRSTKLIHGGVRYLQQGDIKMVMEALYERGLLAKNAPHLVHNQSFIIPTYTWWKGWYFTIGLKIYDLLAGKLGLGSSSYISRKTTLESLSNIQDTNLQGGVQYFDGQFDDARLAVNLAQTAAAQDGTVVNYMRVTGLLKDSTGKLTGVVAHDEETDVAYEVHARTIINCTGVFADTILQMDNPAAATSIVPSQGVHVVVDKDFLPGQSAMLIPQTSDGRVLFAVPWHNKIVLGTTDTLIKKESLEPEALQEEINFILRTAGEYLRKKPERSDVRSVFAGLRPLVATNGTRTKDISRSHKVITAPSGLITVIGGKWTTYRKMGEDTINKAIVLAGLPFQPSVSKKLTVHGGAFTGDARKKKPSVYGSDEEHIQKLVAANPTLNAKLHPAMDIRLADVVWAAQEEMARTVEDVLARRTRMLFLDAKASIESAPAVAHLLADALGYDTAWQKDQIAKFEELAKRYLLS